MYDDQGVVFKRRFEAHSFGRVARAVRRTCTLQLYESCFTNCPPIIVGPPPRPDPNITELILPPCRAPQEKNWTCVRNGHCPVINGKDVCPTGFLTSTEGVVSVKEPSVGTASVIAGSLGGVVAVLIIIVLFVGGAWYRKKHNPKEKSKVVYIAGPGENGTATVDHTSTLPNGADGTEVFYQVSMPAAAVAHQGVGKTPDIINTHNPHLVARQGSNSSQRPLLDSMQDTWSNGGAPHQPLYGAQSFTSLSNNMSPSFVRNRRLSAQSHDVSPVEPEEGAAAQYGGYDTVDSTTLPRRGPPLARSDSQTVPRGAKRVTLGKDYSSNWEKIDEISTMKKNRGNDKELVLDPAFIGLSGFGESEDDDLGLSEPNKGIAMTADQLGMPDRNPFFQQFGGESEEDDLQGFGQDEPSEGGAVAPAREFGDIAQMGVSVDGPGYDQGPTNNYLRQHDGAVDEDDDDGEGAII